MKLPIFQIDAFSHSVFSGNPAAVCPLQEWLPEQVMQQIAAENNLSETAFFVPLASGYELRWFTPTTEVKLCGHATLASAYVVHRELHDTAEEIVFQTKSGELRVRPEGELYRLDFPVQLPVPCTPPPLLIEALGEEPLATYQAEDYLVVFAEQQQVESLTPDFSGLLGLPLRGVIATSSSNDFDFVSRWFGPNVGVNEDPVTGSAHTTLTPYWAERLKKNRLKAKQLSARGGELLCELHGDRVLLYGRAIKYLEGTIFV